MIAPTQSTNTSRQQQQPLAQAPTPAIDIDRRHLMREAWKAYRGEFQRPLKVSENQPDDNVISNRCAPIVDKGVSFLFGQILKIEAIDASVGKKQAKANPVAGVKSTPSTDVQTFLDGIWGDPDDRMTLLSQLSINGAVCGQGFLKLIPSQGLMKFPRILVMNPLLVRLVTSPDDCTLVLAYIIEYSSVSDIQKRQIISRVDPDGLSGVAGEYDLDDSWVIANYIRKDQGSWLQVGEPEVWPWPFAPIFSTQNLPNPNESWGNPDLTPDLINQNKVLNFLQSNTSRILKFHGHPKTFATGVSATQINIGIDDLICLPSSDAKLANLEMHSDLKSSLDFAAIIRGDMDEQSRVPAVALGRLESLPRGNISGVALQLLFQPLIEKTVQKQRLYGRLIRDVSRAALVLGGKISLEEYEDYDVALHWQPLLPADDLVAAQTSVILQTLGVSNSTLLQQLGYDPDTEAEKTGKEAAQQVVNYARGVGLPPSLPGEPPSPPQQAPPQASPFIGGGEGGKNG